MLRISEWDIVINTFKGLGRTDFLIEAEISGDICLRCYWKINGIKINLRLSKAVEKENNLPYVDTSKIING